MKKRNQKLALILSAMMLAASVLTSCGGGGESSDASGGSADSPGPAGAEIPESATIGVMMPHFGTLRNTSTVGQAWEEKMCEELGCDITFEWNYIPYGEYDEKVNIALTADDFPDMMRVMDKNAIIPYQDQEIFLELSGYQDQMTNYMEKVSQVAYGESKVFDEDGNMFGFLQVALPRLEEGIGTSTASLYRYDVFEENGLKIPETTDEFYEAAKKLKELYPDKYPVSRRWTVGETGIFHTSDGIFWNGEAYEYGPVTENYKDMLTWLNKLYAEELLDPECFTEDSDTRTTKRLNGSTFMVLDDSAGARSLNANEEFDGQWVNALYPSDPKYGTAWQGVQNFNEVSIGGEIVIINSDAENVDLLVKLCDLQYRDDIIELTTWGIENDSFVRDEDGKPTFVDEIKNAENPWAEGEKWGMRASSSSRPGLQLCDDTRAYTDFAPNDPCYVDGEVVETPWEKAFPNYSWPDSEMIPPTLFAPPITFTSDEAQSNSTIMTAVQTMVDEYKLKFIKGEESLDNWDSYVQAVEGMGFQQVVDLYNEKAAELTE